MVVHRSNDFYTFTMRIITMRKMVAAYIATVMCISFPVMASTLKNGDTSEQVRTLQEALIKNGYLSGTADGQFGTKTEDAVKLYQQFAGVSDTGVINDIQYLNLTHESANDPGKTVTEYDYSDWKQFASSYEKTQVRLSSETTYYVDDYIGRRLSDFCEFNSGILSGSDGSVELVFEAGNFGDKDAGLTIGANNDIENYIVVYQDPMPDSPIYFSAMEDGKAKVRLGVIDKQMLSKAVLTQQPVKNYVGMVLSSFVEQKGYNYYDNYDGQKVLIKILNENQENIAFPNPDDLSRYTVISQNYPVGAQISFTSEGPYINGTELKNIKLVVRETVAEQRNAIDLEAFTSQQSSASVNGGQSFTSLQGGTTANSTGYILNTKTKVFHSQGCRDINKMDDENKLYSDHTRQEIIAAGYNPCGHCNP